MLGEDDMRVFSNQKVCSTLLHCSLVESVFVFLRPIRNLQMKTPI